MYVATSILLPYKRHSETAKIKIRKLTCAHFIKLPVRITYLDKSSVLGLT